MRQTWGEPPEPGGSLRALVLPEDASGRLDALLAGILPGVSRKRLKLAFREGRVRMEGRVSRGSDLARPGARLEIRDLQGWSSASAREDSPQESRSRLRLEIVHQDEHIVVVEKPAGAPAYPLEPGEGHSVAESLLETFPDMAGVGDQPGAPGLCHRLDLETSGLLLFARTQDAFEEVRRQFRLRLVTKVYLAAAAGHLEGEGVIDVPIGRRSAKRMVPGPPQGMRQWPARTRWTVLDRGSESTLFELTLETGVTHQARVHLAWLGHPLLGDTRYGGPPAVRLGLHASLLGLQHPGSREAVLYRSRGDEELVRMIHGRT